MKRYSKVFVLLILVFIITSQVSSQTKQNVDKTVYVYQENILNHPDGIVGKLSFNFGSSYYSIKNQPGQPVMDAISFHFGSDIVISDNISERQSFTIYKEFTTSYQIGFGLNYYFSNPIQESVDVNPDGKIGTPILKLDAVHLLDNYKETKSFTDFQSQLVLPLSTSFSLFGGYTKYEQISPKDNAEIFGGINLFLGAYPESSHFENPDSPLSTIALSLSGGKSEYGKYGKIEFSLPSSQSSTIKVSAQGNFLEAPFDKIYTGTMQFIYYAGK